MSELKKEVAIFDDFLLLDIEEQYSKLPIKTLVMVVIALFLFFCGRLYAIEAVYTIDLERSIPLQVIVFQSCICTFRFGLLC